MQRKLSGSVKPARAKGQKDIADEWGTLAGVRANQIETGKDLSYEFVLAPCISRLCAPSDFSSVIDVGCGVGFLTRMLSTGSGRIVGIDMSQRGIEVARKHHRGLSQVEFVNASVEQYASQHKNGAFTLATANMTLMTTLDLEGVLRAVAKLLKPGAHFVFTITHPCFWPLYWGYADENWFDYRKEIAIEAPFRISLDDSGHLATTHVHRPLAGYFRSLLRAGFVMERVEEPFPDEQVQAKYPERWKYPRFLGVRCALG